MKRLLRCHQWMGKDGGIRFIKDYFSMSDAESHLFCYLANFSSQTAPFLLLTPKRKSILSFSYKRTIVQNKNFLPKQKIADQYLSSQISRRETNDLLRTQFRPKNMV